MKKLLLLLLVTLVTFGVNAQYTFEEINISPTFGDSNPSRFVEFNGELYFSSTGTTSDEELWKTDGTFAGTVLVKNINPTGKSQPRRLTVYNNELYFSADTPNEGRELWKTDGTTAGTVMVKDILTGVGDGLTARYDPFKIFNNKLIFSGTLINPNGGSFLFESDGTEAGTNPMQTAASFSEGNGSHGRMVILGNYVYFIGYSSNEGSELWKTDGNIMTLVKDINPGTAHSIPQQLTVFNNKIYFSADGGTFGRELWKTDGTGAGTVLVKDIYPGVFSSFTITPKFQVFKNKLFFATYTLAAGREIWVSDGTEAGTQLFFDTSPTLDVNGAAQSGIFHSSDNAKVFYPLGDKMYFTATTSYSASNHPNNIEPWVTDGTVAGTMQLADINPNGNAAFEGSFYHEYNNKVFFNTYEPDTTNRLLWMYDPSTGNTPVKIAPPNTTFTDVTQSVYINAINFKNSLFINGAYEINNVSHGIELWRITDNTLSITEIDISTNITMFPNPAINQIAIALKNNESIKKIEIYTLLGKRVLAKNSSQSETTVNVSSLSAGLYIVKIAGENHTYSQKLIIK